MKIEKIPMKAIPDNFNISSKRSINNKYITLTSNILKEGLDGKSVTQARLIQRIPPSGVVEFYENWYDVLKDESLSFNYRVSLCSYYLSKAFLIAPTEVDD